MQTHCTTWSNVTINQNVHHYLCVLVRMKQSIHDAEQLMDELEEIRSLSAEKDGATGNLESYIKQLVGYQEVV